MSYRYTGDDQSFEEPGPGTWKLLDGHFPRPLSRYYCTIDGGPMEEGQNSAAAEYGYLIERKTAIVNRFYYMAQRPVNRGEADDDGGLSFDERVDRLRNTYQQRAWQRAVEQWDTEWKPSVREAGRELVAVDPDTLAVEALIEHLNACRSITWDARVHHFRLLPPLDLAIGDFLAQAADWTGRAEGELLRLLDGSSPASAGLDEELARVKTAIATDGVAEAVLHGNDPPETIIDRLRNRPTEVGEAIEEWLVTAGYRTVSGYDVADAYALEQPEVLVRTLRRVVDEDVDSHERHADERFTEIREAVQATNRETFDEVLTEARAIYRVRDESSLLALWAQGVLRRGLLAAGRYLADHGRLHNPEHVVELTHEELLDTLRGETGPSADEVASFAEYRLTHDSDDAPDTLGSDEDGSSRLDLEADLPEPAARALRGRRAVQQAWTWGIEENEEPSERAVDGVAASPGTYEGTARLVRDPTDFAAIEEGDVLVAEMTSSAFNVILPLLGAIVTDKGGMLSHPAIVAREFGIPAVVNSKDGTERIRSGDQIVVDGDSGTVTFVE